ncbi:integrase [Methylobacterium indicum]|uniref:Integrase n=2 Tax=Methylobacterium indicum TaxID=1775910 RepID=A0ABR5HGR6_9HYPH|nr:integrase [Methylobacterium indicum]KMO25784.1 integrase [Methylobacterium indicum]
MDPLAMDLKQMGLNNGGGAFHTRVQRTRGFVLIARELRAMGHVLPSARSIKEIHVQKLVAKWKADGLATGTIKNRLSWMRTWSANVRKGSVIPKSNADVGIALRNTFTGNRAHVTPKAKLAKLDERMQLAVRLQMAFGMRVEESILFRPEQAIQGNELHMQATWCKGGRARVIPVFHPNQWALLDELRSVVGTGCLVPPGMKSHAYRDQLDRKTWAAGIHDKHGHRHWYAQRRYELLTGRPCTAAGGRPWEQLTGAERRADWHARLTISRELGHERRQITDAYLGYRFASRKGGA